MGFFWENRLVIMSAFPADYDSPPTRQLFAMTWVGSLPGLPLAIG